MRMLPANLCRWKWNVEGKIPLYKPYWPKYKFLKKWDDILNIMILTFIIDIIERYSDQTMRIALAFVYYFVIMMIGLTVLLSLLCLKKIRHITFKLLNRVNVKQFPVTKMIFWIVILIVVILLIDSIMTYQTVSASIESNPNHQT